MPIEFRILGPLEVSADGRALPLGSRKQRALLGLLVVHANEPVSRDRLIEELWGEAAPATVESALHVYLSRLRTLLGSAGAGGALVRETYGYRLRVEPDQVDANRFDRLVGEGREALAGGRPEVAAALLRLGLGLWRGAALADLQSEPFAMSAGARLEEQRIAALEQRLEADLALGRDRELVGELETIVARHPYREGLRAQLMLALYHSGRQVEALRVYQDARRTLIDELGLEPGQELKDLEQAILRQDASLALQRPGKPETEPELLVSSATPAPPPREERKVVSVLVADLLGFTARAERLDPEEVRALQDRYWAPVRAEIERHGGTAEEFAGGVAMAVFGVPRAHEDDPERAVRAALMIRDWAKGELLDVRIAVTTGEALVRLGGPSAGEGTAAGDVVNTAVRLAAGAPVNGILVGDRTFGATSHAIAYRDRKPRRARGKTGPLRTWEAMAVLSPLGAAADDRRRAPLIGRDRELELLVATLARVRAQRTPELVTLVGVPGIGKSRLIEELRRAVGAERGPATRWYQGRSLPYGDGISVWALVEIVRGHVGALANDTVAAVEGKTEQAVKTLLGQGPEAEWVARQLRPLVGIADVNSATDRDEAFAGWRRFLEGLADDRPLVLVFEDLQWADETLLDFVDGLAEWVSNVPLLILATARPELLDRRPQWAGGKPNAFTLSLRPLSDSDSSRLLAALSHRQPATDEARSVLMKKVGGNPFYAEQYARGLEEHAETSEPPLPETVQGMIAARLDLLPVGEKGLLQDAAVLGEVFTAPGVAALQGTDQPSVDARLRELERKQFLQRSARSPVAEGAEWAFCHVLLRDVAYAQTTRVERARKHQGAAEWIEALGRPQDNAEALAHHYTCAYELRAATGEDSVEAAARARAALRAAGDRAIALNASAAAARYFERALELCPKQDRERPRLLFGYASALHEAGDSRQEEMLASACEALLASGELEAAAETEAQLAEMSWLVGGHEEHERHLERAATLVRGRAASPAKARVLAHVAFLRGALWQNVEAIRAGREALAVAERVGVPELRPAALMTVGFARFRAGDPAGVADIEHGLELALARGSLTTVEQGYTDLAAVMLVRGELGRHDHLLAEAERTAQQLGNRPRLRRLRAYRSDIAFWRGEWDKVVPFADEFIAECEAGAAHADESDQRAFRATIRLARDDVEGALADCEKAVAHARYVGRPDIAPEVLAAAAAIYLELDRPEEALTLSEEALSYHPGRVRFVSPDLVWNADAFGRPRELEAALARMPATSGWRIAGELILADRFDEAADAFAAMGVLEQEARARVRAAQQLVEQGRHKEGEAQLEKALSFYRSVRATRYIRQAEALLMATRAASKRDRRVVLPNVHK